MFTDARAALQKSNKRSEEIPKENMNRMENSAITNISESIEIAAKEGRKETVIESWCGPTPTKKVLKRLVRELIASGYEAKVIFNWNLLPLWEYTLKISWENATNIVQPVDVERKLRK